MRVLLNRRRSELALMTALFAVVVLLVVTSASHGRLWSRTVYGHAGSSTTRAWELAAPSEWTVGPGFGHGRGMEYEYHNYGPLRLAITYEGPWYERL